MALVADHGAVGGPGTAPCIMNNLPKSPLAGIGDSGEERWSEFLDLDNCLGEGEDVLMDTTLGAPNTPPEGEQVPGAVVRGIGAHGRGGSSDSGRDESNEGAGVTQSGAAQPVSANSNGPGSLNTARGERMGSAEQGASPRQHDMRSPRQQDLRSPRHQELKRPVSPNVSDKSSGKGSGKGPDDGPFKGSQADGKFVALQQGGEGSLGIPNNAGDAPDELSMFLKNLSWFWRSEDPGCRLFSVQQFQRYSCNREHAGVIAQTSGALRYLVYILQLSYLSENDQSKAAAAYALQNLAYHSSATRERIAQAGAIPVLVQLLQSPDDTVREAGAGCLANLAMEPAILEDIVQKDGVPFMLQLLRGSRGCIEEALCFLFLFVKKSHENQVRLARYGIMQILMHLLSTPLSPRAQRLIGLIWSLYLPSGELAVQHEFTKAVPLLIQLVRVGSREAQDAAAILLADYCKQDEENARLFRKYGGAAVFQSLQQARPSNHPVWSQVMDVLMSIGAEASSHESALNPPAAAHPMRMSMCHQRASSTTNTNRNIASVAGSHASFSRTDSMSTLPSPSTSSNPMSHSGQQQRNPAQNPGFGPPGLLLMQPPPPNVQGPPNMAMVHPGMVPVPQPGMVPIQQPGMVPIPQPGMVPVQQPGMVPVQQPGMVPVQQPGMVPVQQPGMVPVPQPGLMSVPQQGMVPIPQQGPLMHAPQHGLMSVPGHGMVGMPQMQVLQPGPSQGMPVQMMQMPVKSLPVASDVSMSVQHSGAPSLSGSVGNVALPRMI